MGGSLPGPRFSRSGLSALGKWALIGVVARLLAVYFLMVLKPQ